MPATAKYYTEHLDGSIESGFTSRGKSLAQIKQELKNFVYEMPYTWSNKFTGIGLTGETIPYSTLSEYYTYYGMENPDDKAVVLPEDPEQKPVVDADEPTEEDPSKETPADGATEEPEAPAETDKKEDTTTDSTTDSSTSKPEESESTVTDPETKEPESTVTEKPEDTAEPDSESVEEPDAEPKETASITGLLKSFLSSFTLTVCAAKAEDLPVAEEATADEKKEEAGILDESAANTDTEETDATVEAPEEETEKSEAPSDEAAPTDTTSPAEVEEEESTIDPDTGIDTATGLYEGWVPEDQLPDDFYIYRDFRINTYNMGGETPSNIYHNFVVWRGQVTKSLTATPTYLQPGEYTIRIIPRSQSLQAVSLPFTIAGSGADGELTEEDLLAVIFRDMIFFPGFASGFPSLKMCTGGDPIDLLSGSLSWNYTDLTLSGKYPLTFSRTYLSGMRELDDSGLGNGWSHNYDYRAEIFEGNVDVYLPGGGHIYYYTEYDGTLTTNKGNSWHMEKSGDGYFMRNDDGRTVLFDGDGHAVRITEAGGDVINLSYDGDHLTKISNTSGSLTLSYSGDHITSVSDSAGRTMSLSYAGSDLASVQNPDGDSFNYAYDENHCLTQITDLNGNLILENTYDDTGHITEQKMPDRGKMTMTYDPDNRTNTYSEEGGDTQTVVYDDPCRIISFTEDAGTETYEYDELNRLTSETDRNRNATSFEYDREYT